MIIHPISEAELERFGIFDDGQGPLLCSQLKDAWRTGKTKAEWCLVAEHAGGWAGRVLLNAAVTPIFIHFFDVDWSRDNADAIARDLIGATIKAAKREAERDLLYALDEPHPWHSQPDRRRRLFADAGFTVAREALRWQWPQGSPAPTEGSRLMYRTIAEVGEDAYRDAIARVSDGTLDARLRAMRSRLGRDGDAAEHLRVLRGLSQEPSQLQLGFDRNGELVGLFAGGATDGIAIVAYVGVVAEKRGQRYGDELLVHGTQFLLDSGEDVIRADTDVANVPMARAFERVGYLNFAKRTELVLTATALKQPRPDADH